MDFQGGQSNGLGNSPVDQDCIHPRGFTRSNRVSHQSASPPFDLAFGGGHPWQDNLIHSEIPRSDEIMGSLADFLGQMLFLHRGLALCSTCFFGGGYAWKDNPMPREIPRLEDIIATPGDFLGMTLFLVHGLPLCSAWFFGRGHP
jgi:hypothetical protein